MGEVVVKPARATVVAVVGPTAAGKSAVALEMALRTKGEIISADARQVYRYMDIGTAKPSAMDRSRVPHHLVDILEPNADYNAGRFAEDARSAMRDVLARGRLPVMVGGSGLYLRAALDGLFYGPHADPGFRTRLEALFAERGEAALREELRAVDPGTEARIERGKPRRLIRALEVHALTGVPLSEHHRRQDRVVEFDVRWMGIMPSREELYRRIDLRVISMVEQGLVGEVRGLIARGFDRRMNALNTVGYREVFDMLEGVTDESTIVRRIQDHTRQYAKRQMTWFRADGRIRWLDDVDRRPPGELASDITSAIGA
jgi:tRNA dimethylallyltransferase